MNYYEQMLLSLKPQRRQAERMRDAYVITFFLVDVVLVGSLFALMEFWGTPLLAVFLVSAVSMVLTFFHLRMAAYYDGAVSEIEATLAVTARNQEEK